MTLDKLPKGQRATIREVDGTHSLSTRLVDLGLWAGTSVEVLHRIPFGGPVVCRLRGYLLALRRDEAALVTLEPEESPHE